MPDPSVPDPSVPDPSVPDASVPDASVPDASVPDTAKPDDVARLIEFLSDRDVSCPNCRHNLRDLTRPLCPECRHELELTVGVTSPRFLWFLLAVTPCTFAGIAAALLLIPMTIQSLTGGGPPQASILALDALGWLSALGGLVLIRYRFVFLRQPSRRQRTWAAVVWGINVLAIVAFFLTLLITG